MPSLSPACRAAAVDVLKALAEKSSDVEAVASMLDILCKVPLLAASCEFGDEPWVSFVHNDR